MCGGYDSISSAAEKKLPADYGKRSDKVKTEVKTTAERLASYLESLAAEKSKPETHENQNGTGITLNYGNFGYLACVYANVPKEKLVAEALAKGLVKQLDGKPLPPKPEKSLQCKVAAGQTFYELAAAPIMGNATSEDVKAACALLGDTGKWGIRIGNKSGYPWKVTLLTQPNGAVKTSKALGAIIV